MSFFGLGLWSIYGLWPMVYGLCLCLCLCSFGLGFGLVLPYLVYYRFGLWVEQGLGLARVWQEEQPTSDQTLQEKRGRSAYF